ncbi:hypothetical protein SAMN04489761_3840 [Tenacibaculum sp. MAR_2009_124]|nr:hypothetical protein SAMN04489761_3840 [Tenacibaculum sp. MAR_2009_124]
MKDLSLSFNFMVPYFRYNKNPVKQASQDFQNYSNIVNVLRDDIA